MKSALLRPESAAEPDDDTQSHAGPGSADPALSYIAPICLDARMDTTPRPSLRDWIIARRAAGLPVVSPNPREQRPRLNVRAPASAGDSGKPVSRSSTDRLSDAERPLPPRLNIRASIVAENDGKRPARTSTDRLSINGVTSRPHLNVGTSAAPENGSKPALPDATNPPGKAGIASRSSLNVRAPAAAERCEETPPQSSTDRLTNAAATPRPQLNIRAPTATETDETPPPQSSTNMLSIADGIALVHVAREQHLDACFAALADPTRRAMLAMLVHGECSVGALAAPHAMSLAAAARHVAVLDRAGLIARRQIGRRHLCRLHATALTEATGWLNRFAVSGRDACRPASTR